MKKAHIILAAVILYLLIMVIGGMAYYAYSLQHEEKAAQQEQAAQQEIAARRQAREAADKAKDGAIADAEAKKAQQKAAQRERAQGKMWEETINGVTYYKHHWPKKMPSGVYLRPFIATQNEICVLKNDIYYYYSITDEQQTAWIMGDRLDITAGGQTTTLVLDPSTMRKHMASDASWLSENYVMNADQATIDAFRRIAAAGAATIVYYKTDGKARSHELGGEEVQRIRDMVELYDTLRQE